MLGGQPLKNALTHGYSDIVKLLIELDAMISSDILTIILRTNDIALIKDLILTNKIDSMCKLPLGIRYGTIKLLIEYNIININGMLYILSFYRNPGLNIIELFVSSGLELNNECIQSLTNAALPWYNKDVLNWGISNGADINKAIYNSGPLKKSLIKFLLEHGADPNICLPITSGYGGLKLCIDYGADTYNNELPEFLKYESNIKTFELLVKNGINKTNLDILTNVAYINCLFDIYNYLVENGGALWDSTI